MQELNSQFVFKNSYGLQTPPDETQSGPKQPDIGQGVRGDGGLDMSRVNDHQYFLANREAIIERLNFEAGNQPGTN